MLVVAIPAGLLIGLSLGALGGGSILTVPVLVYLLHQQPHLATTGSLLIVGVTALVGVAAHWRAGRVRLTQGATFGVLGVAGSYAGTKLSASIQPDLLLTLFALLMLVAAAAMLRRRRQPAGRPQDHDKPAIGGSGNGMLEAPAPGGPVTTGTITLDRPKTSPAPGAVITPLVHAGAGRRAAKVILAATGVGLLTGFFGVGGGFVIVPALVLALGFDMPVAVGTSLLVISINSAAALTVRLGSHVHLDWTLLAAFTLAALAGTLAGNRVASRVDAARLTTAFTVLLAVVAVYSLCRSLPGLM
jgi:uncharacterized membrane protein YfcA